MQSVTSEYMLKQPRNNYFIPLVNFFFWAAFHHFCYSRQVIDHKIHVLFFVFLQNHITVKKTQEENILPPRAQKHSVPSKGKIGFSVYFHVHNSTIQFVQ